MTEFQLDLLNPRATYEQIDEILKDIYWVNSRPPMHDSAFHYDQEAGRYLDQNKHHINQSEYSEFKERIRREKAEIERAHEDWKNINRNNPTRSNRNA